MTNSCQAGGFNPRRLGFHSLLAVLLTVLPFLSLQGLAQQASDPGLILEKIQKKYSAAPSCRASFVQTYAPAGFGETKPETGTMALQAPDSIRFDYDGSEGKVFTFDGKAARQFVAKDRQLIVRTLSSEERNRLPLLFLNQASQIRAQFEVRIAEASPALKEVKLSPKTGSDPKEITVTVALDGEVKRLVILDSSGNKTAFTFTAFETGKHRSASDFSLLPPPGTKIISE